MQKKITTRTNNPCPRCSTPLHTGSHKFSDGIETVTYCKTCGYREEKKP